MEQSGSNRHLHPDNRSGASGVAVQFGEQGRLFDQNQIDVLQQAFELACGTFERRRQLTATEREDVARAVLKEAESGVLRVRSLATKAIIRAATTSLWTRSRKG